MWNTSLHTGFSSFFLEEESFSLSNAKVVGKGHKMGIFIWFYHCRYWSSSATKSSGKFLLLPLSKALFIFRYLSIESEEKCCARIIILFLISTFSLRYTPFIVPFSDVLSSHSTKGGFRLTMEDISFHFIHLHIADVLYFLIKCNKNGNNNSWKSCRSRYSNNNDSNKLHYKK